MNKAVIALLLLGLVVVAMAGEAGRDKNEKMRLKKAKIMAKKEKMHMEKMKKQMLPETAKHGKEMARGEGKSRIVDGLASLRQQLEDGLITIDEFKDKVREFKEEARRQKASKESARKEETRKEKAGSRNKRSLKDKNMRKMKPGMKANKAIKERRSP